MSSMSEHDQNPEASTFTEDNEEDLLVSQLNMNTEDQYVVFSIGKEDYGIPILSVQEIISLPNLTRLPGVPEYIPGIINLRGTVIPLYLLRNRLGLEPPELNDQTTVVIVQLNEGSAGSDASGAPGSAGGLRTVGFIVDAVSDVISIDEENFRETPGFSGNVDVNYVKKIGYQANRMIIIIDLENFFTATESEILQQAQAGNE